MNTHDLRRTPLAAGPTEDERALMKQHDITFDGTHYHFSGYRYAGLADALNYAQLVRQRPAEPGRGPVSVSHPTVAELTAADREQMSKLGIDVEAGSFRFAGFRYERLVDAVAYAKLAARRLGVDREGR